MNDARALPLLVWCLLAVHVLCSGTVQHLSLKYRQGAIRRHGRIHSPRQLFETAELELHGKLQLGYYYVELQIGTPPQTFDFIVDSGSTLLYVPCADCGNQCGHHLSMPYDMAASSTGETLLCSSEDCRNTCLDGRCCDADRTCKYTLRYQEGSSIRGRMVKDVLHFSGLAEANTVPVPFVFGCQTFESGMIKDQEVDGIVGVGAATRALPNQLAAAHAMSPAFTLCFGHLDGVFLLGALPQGSLATVIGEPLTVPRSRLTSRNSYYNVQVRGVKFANKHLAPTDIADLDNGYGVIFDSGTTFTYVPPAFHQMMVHELNKIIKAHSYQSLQSPYADDDFCFSTPDLETLTDLASVFPNLTLTFSTGSFDLLPKGYLWRYPSRSPLGWCLGVYAEGGGGAVLGGIALRDIAITYDSTAVADANKQASASPSIRLAHVSSCVEFGDAVQTAAASTARAASAPYGGPMPAPAPAAVPQSPPAPAVAPAVPSTKAPPRGSTPPTNQAGSSPSGSQAASESGTGDVVVDPDVDSEDNSEAGFGRRRLVWAFLGVGGFVAASWVGLFIYQRRKQGTGVEYAELVDEEGRSINLMQVTARTDSHLSRPGSGGGLGLHVQGSYASHAGSGQASTMLSPSQSLSTDVPVLGQAASPPQPGTPKYPNSPGALGSSNMEQGLR